MLFLLDVSLRADALSCAWYKTLCVIAAAGGAAGTTKKADVKQSQVWEGRLAAVPADRHRTA